MSKATRDSWINTPLPNGHITLDYTRTFSNEEFEKLTHGFIPKSMDDKWFIYFRINTLYFHRSWTGRGIYAVQIQKAGDVYQVSKVSCTRDERHEDLEREKSTLNLLINMLLSGESHEQAH
jgi:hypothetical protein